MAETDARKIEDLPDLGARTEFVATEPGVQVRLLRIPCREPRAEGTILFVAGWMSFADAWRLVLGELSTRFEVVYMESREKNSSRIDRRRGVRFRIEELVNDYHGVVRHLGASRPLQVIASSIGAATVIRGFQLGVRPGRLALISPILRPEVPAWIPPVARIARGPIYAIAKTLASWWYGLFIFRVSRDEFQRSRFRGVLQNAEPWKMLQGVRDIADLRIPMSEVRQVDVPVCILAASQDPQHRADDIREIAENISDCRIHDFRLFRRTHSRAAGRTLAHFFGPDADGELEVDLTLAETA